MLSDKLVSSRLVAPIRFAQISKKVTDETSTSRVRRFLDHCPRLSRETQGRYEGYRSTGSAEEIVKHRIVLLEEINRILSATIVRMRKERSKWKGKRRKATDDTSSRPPTLPPATCHSSTVHLPLATCHSPLQKLLREPLLHFLLIGAGLFLLFGWRGGPASLPGGPSGVQATRIIINQSDIDQLIDTFTRTWQRPPSKEEAKSLVEDLVRSEIYYREALAIGLDRDDAVIRRRMRQKMEFIFEDISALAEPTDEDLQAFLKKHSEQYLVDPQVSFKHVYVNADKRGKNAESDARQILAQLNEGVDPDTVGDSFCWIRRSDFHRLWDIKKQFGESSPRASSG